MEFEPFGAGVLNQVQNISLVDTNFYFHPPRPWGSLSVFRTLLLQPVFIRNNDQDPSPTGVSFNTLLLNANLIWQKCCIQFHALPPIFVNNSSYRVIQIPTNPDGTDDDTELHNLLNEVNVDDAIEIFVVERFDPVAKKGGGATWSSGTANAKIITGDNQLPVNQNHLGHELGHVLNLDHPGISNPPLIPGCSNTIMEPSGFFADNPDEQCNDNCVNKSNPLTRSHWWHLCRYRPDI
jgi:hypothetical protein